MKVNFVDLSEKSENDIIQEIERDNSDKASDKAPNKLVYKSQLIFKDLEIIVRGEIYKFGDFIIKIGKVEKFIKKKSKDELKKKNPYILIVEYIPLYYLEISN